MSDALATDEEISRIVASLEAPDADDVAALDTAILRFPEDPRLHFMLGSVFAGQGENIKAHRALSRAVELAPAYDIARYQLGFFELTSGEADKALSTWGPLLNAPRDNALRVFVEGMTHLIRDEFDPALASFEKGLALNTANEPLNNDIKLIMRELRSKVDNPGTGSSETSDEHKSIDETSASALLLGQFGGNRTIN